LSESHHIPPLTALREYSDLGAKRWMLTVTANRIKLAGTAGTRAQADESLTDDGRSSTGRTPDGHEMADHSAGSSGPGRGAAGRAKVRPGLVVVAVVLGAMVAAAGVFLAPRVPSLSTQITGDQGLAVQTLPYLDGALDVVSVATVDGSVVAFAGFGADENTVYEIGSITKTFTAALFADAVTRGEVNADTLLAELLPVDGTPVASVTLAELASHRSGLPRDGMDTSVPKNLLLLTHRSVYTEDIDGLLAVARSTDLTNRGSYLYSTLGTALLGQALAAATNVDYSQLLRDRMLRPLGMMDTTVTVTAGDLPVNVTAGFNADGQHHQPWTNHAWAPAGGMRSTAADMAKYASALLDGTAPGMDALTPQWDEGNGTRTGYAWNITPYQGETVTAHGGATGGFCAAIALDRTHHRAVIVLSNTKVPVEDAARTLLLEST
jgi:CubicO group peptidase (beta-lactamase class C family)